MLRGLDIGTDDSWTRLFDHVIFCTNVTYADGNSKAGTHAHRLLSSFIHCGNQI